MDISPRAREEAADGEEAISRPGRLVSPAFYGPRAWIVTVAIALRGLLRDAARS